jgi:RNA polymerase sigma-70 factor (ECF subfamily)
MMHELEKEKSTSTSLRIGRDAKVRPLRFTGDDTALVGALKQKHPGAMEALYDRYGAHVRRVLVRVMGIDNNLGDMLHEVFIETFSNVRSIKDGSCLKAWITSISIYTARQRIRRRMRRRAFWMNDIETVPDIPISGSNPEEREALRATYQILDAMPTDERIAFTLRFVEGMELEETAQSCRVSLSTIKRRLSRAESRFLAFSRRFPALVQWIREGDRWRVE